MEKDPKKVNPGNPFNKTYPGQDLNNGVLPNTTDMLPAIFRTETNKKVLSAVVEDLFQPSSIETLNYTIGRSATSLFGSDYLPHPTARRQGEVGLVSFNDTGVKTLTADNIATAWSLNDRTNEVPAEVSVLDLPIDPDKFLNWGDYYWIEERMPVVFLTGGKAKTYSVQNDIIGKKYYSLPVQSNGRTLELKNGMRVVFQQYPNQLDVESDLNIEFLASGTTQDQFPNIELLNYDKNLIVISVDNVLQTVNTNYKVFGSVIYWQDGFVPTAGQTISVGFTNFYLTPSDSLKLRPWLVSGVGTEEGIKLLGLQSQFTNTVYSKLDNALWDQTAVTWDRAEWDGLIPGINPKQYILQQVGAANRNAHSRTNVWIHKTAIQTLADFLDIRFNDIADESNKAERPIVEFENTLELYNHGVRYRHWPTFLVNEETVDVADFNNIPLTSSNVTALDPRYVSLITKLNRPVDIIVQTEIFDSLKLALDASTVTKAELNKILNNLDKDNAAGRIPKYAVYEVVNNAIVWIKNAPTGNWIVTYRISNVLLSALRILWLKNDSLKDKIVSITNNGTRTVGFAAENAKDGDAVVINVTSPADPHYLHEYYWKNGQATKATFRTTFIDQPKFEIYSNDATRLSDYESVTGNRPNIQYSTILRPKAGTTTDLESGYKLTFDSNQFTQITEGNVARNSMYNIVYEHTLQTPSVYTNSSGQQYRVFGPYSFRRYAGIDTVKELSNGYRQSWFKLKSWAIRSQIINGETTLQLDDTMWPAYDWAIKVENDTGTVAHLDTFESVVDNTAVVARNHTATFTLYIGSAESTATVSGLGFDSFDVDIVDNTVKFTVPESALDSLSVVIGSISVTAKIIDLKNDPRFIKLTLNNLPVEYTFDSNNYTVTVNGSGVLEIRHQGNKVDNDNLTSIPGLDYNPEQLENLGEVTVARLIKGLKKNIEVNTASGARPWVETPQYKTLDGIYMANHSAMRSSWALMSLNPKLQDVVVARSMSAWRWHRRFIAKLEELNRLLEISNAKDTVDRILEELLLGVTYSSTDAVSGMAFITNAMEVATYTSTGEQVFATPADIYAGAFGNDHVYVYLNGNIQLNQVDYTISSTAIEFVEPTANGDTVEIYYSAEPTLYSGIPASPAKLGLSGLFLPKLITEQVGTHSRTYIQRHDGSRITAYIDPATGVASEDYFINAVILELEKRIYNGCLNRVGQVNRQRSFRNYDAEIVTESQSRSQLEWFAANNIDYRDRADFSATDPWTWNYGGVSWRRLYIDLYGTYSLHEAPWEALGYDNKPAWWDTHYSWTDATKRTALEQALQYGIISEPGTALYTDPAFARNATSYPVDNNGNLLSPFTFGLVTPTLAESQQPWEIGSLGPAEFAWKRSVAGAWSNVLHVIDQADLVNEFIDSSINPFVAQLKNNSVKPKGTGTVAPDQFFQQRPTIGIGAVLFEGYREFNLLGEAPLNELMSVSTRLEFSVGGFTDGNVSIKMDYTKYQDSEYVPVEDFGITLNPGVPTSQLRYTSVRIETDDVGFRVYGFDPSQRFFKVLTPSANAMSAGYPTTRRQMITPYGTFTEYLDWNTTPTVVSYGSYIANKQELVTFLLGLGEYQKSCGLVLDTIDNGVVVDWKKAAVDALGWANENWGTDTYCIVGVATQQGLQFKHATGFLSRLDAELGRTGKILYVNSRSATANELLITRDFAEETDKVTPLSDQQIVFVNFETQEYDHVFFVHKQTKFGDLLADLQCGNRLEKLTLSGRRTYNWTGRPHAPGVLPQQNSVLPGFDTLVNDIVASQNPERVAFDTLKTAIARADVVPSKQSVVFDVIQDSSSAYLYRQGLQGSVGTNLAIDALFRNRTIDTPTSSQDIDVNEQWMFSTGEFGLTSEKTVWELELRREDVTSNRQVVRFKENSNNGGDLRSDSIIDIVGARDPRWVSRPFAIEFGTISRDDIDQTYTKSQNWLPSAGLADLVETDVKLVKLVDLTLDKIKSVDKQSGNLSISQVFSTRSFNRFTDYNQGDLAWNKGTLYRANERIAGSATSAFDSSQWTALTIDGTVLPSVWVSDYGFTLEQGIVASADSAWVANQQYNVGDIVLVNDNYYKCIVTNSQPVFAKFAVSGAEITASGRNYKNGDVVTFNSADGLGSGASGFVTVIDGYLESININNVDPEEQYNIATTSIVDANNDVVATLAFNTAITPVANEYKYISSVAIQTPIGNNYDPAYTNVTLTVGNQSYNVTPVFGSTSANVVIAGRIRSVEITAPGQGYQIGDIISLVNQSNEQTDAKFEVTGVFTPATTVSNPTPAPNQITTLKVLYAGKEYVEGQEYEVTGGSGTGAMFTVTSTVDITSQPLTLSNAIVGVTLGEQQIVTNLTTGTLTVSRVPQRTGDSVYRRAFATVENGKVTSVQITGTGAGAVASVDDITATIDGDGQGATIKPIITNRQISGFEITNQGNGYTFANVRISDPNWAPQIISNVNVTLGLTTVTELESYEVATISGIDTIVATDPEFTVGQVLRVVDTSGVGSTVNVTVSSTIDGVVTGFTLTNPGNGYELVPAAQIVSESGQGAQLASSIDKFWEILPQGYGWNVLQAFAPMYIEEICPNALEPGLNESKASFANPHRLIPGNYIIISGTNDGNYDTVHRVKAVVDDYNILIEARSTSDTVVYDAVGFALNAVKFKTEDELTNSTLTFAAGMKAYVDGGDIEGSYTVYNFTSAGKVSLQNFEKILVNTPMIDSQSIYKVQLFDYETRELVSTLEIFDPYKGLTIDEVAQYIDYKQLPDPAVYNITELNVEDELAVNTWGANRVGTLWWDLDKVRYVEYEQYSTVQERASHWGERFADSEVVIYEWVSSVEIPTIETEPDARLDTSANLNGQIRYSAVEETGSTGAISTRYYFWKRHVNTVPAGGTRPYSAVSIESVLNNPDANGVAWFSPINTNAFVITNVNSALSQHNKLVLRIEKNTTPEQVHSNNVLVTEGFNGDIINNYLYRQLAVSVAGRDNYRESYKLQEYVAGNTYAAGQYVWIENNGEIVYNTDYKADDYPVLQKLDDTRADVQSVRVASNGADHNIYYVARSFTATSMSADIESRFLVKSAVSAIITDPYENTGAWHAVINTRRRVPDSGLHPLRRYGNAYTPRPQSWFKDIFNARRTLVVAANDYLLNIDTVSKPNWDKYLRTYKPLHGPYERNISEFWTYVDYTVNGYETGNEQVLLQSSAEIATLDSSVTNFGIVDETGTVVEAYNKANNDITLVYRKNGTIQFLNTIWNGALGEAWDRARWDSHRWDEDGSEIIESIFKALRYNIFVGEDVGYFNNLFFALVKESLSQIPYADWIVKTTYLNVTQTSDNELVQVGSYYNKKEQIVNDYINEVKPYHSKIVESDRFSTAQQQVAVSVGEAITLTTWTFKVLQTEDQTDIATEDGRRLTTETTVTVQQLTEGQG